MKEVTLSMTQRQITRYHTVMKSLTGELTVKEASDALGLSERHVIRLRNGVKTEGAASLVHKNKNKPSQRTIPKETKERVVSLYRSHEYKGANFLHFTELLSEREGIKLSYATVRNALVSAGERSPKKHRRRKPHRRRPRKAQEGLLIQMDATPFEWFGGKAKFTLHGGIDDATGKVVGAYMAENECLHGYFETMRQIVGGNGVPVSVYTDRHTIFRSPKAGRLTVGEQLEGKQAPDTQFGRAMKELGVNLICARTPQAKGRVERLWETLQSRLPIEFRVHGIETVHEANAFLAGYIPRFNGRFAVEPGQAGQAYVPLARDLDLALCVKEPRAVDNGGAFTFHGRTFVVDGVPAKAKIDVVASAAKGIVAMYKGKPYGVAPFVKPKKAGAGKTAAARNNDAPPDDHAWRVKMPPFSSDLAYPEIYSMLNEIFLSGLAV
jgi:transposase